MKSLGKALRSRSGLLWLVLLLALALSLPGGIGLAAPSLLGVREIPTNLPEQQEEVPICDLPPGGCNKIQVVVMIDQSFSMPRNDPQRLRFLGAENLADLLAHRYLGALATEIPTPTIELSVLHFGTEAPQQYNSGWLTIAPDSEEIWAEQFDQLRTKISPERLKRKGLNATNFINPFKAARELLGQASPQDQGCPQRVILLLTDGAPAGAQVFRGAALKDHMTRVATIAKESMSGDGNFIYVTAFNVRGDDYWRETRPYWQQITGDDSRSRKENTPKDIAIRMEEIVATHLGYQSLAVKDGQFVVPAYLQSIRTTYYARNKSASFTMVDPEGNTVTPDGEKITLTGQETLIQVMVIKFPKPGAYQIITSEPGGTITVLPTYVQLTPKIETSASGLQQFTSGDILLTLLDNSGKPVTRVDDPVNHLDLRAVLQQGDQTSPLALSDDGSSFKATFLPVSSEPARMEVTAILQDTQGMDICRLNVEPSNELNVAPVAFQVGEISGQVCSPSQMPITYPLSLINVDTRAPTVISVPVAWKVSSTTLSGHPVEASISETGTGQYQLSLRSDKAEDIRTSISASAEVEGRTHPFFKEVEFLTSGLLQDRTLAFELGNPEIVADDWSLFFNRLFRPAIRDYPGQILIGRRLFGWLGSQDITISGHFFNPASGEDETDIERFFIQLAREDGSGPLIEKANGWIAEDGGISTLNIPAPRLGAYRVNVIDEGGPVACTTIGGLPTLNILLINDFWEYIFWIVMLLLVLLLLAWLIWMTGYRQRNRRKGEPS